MIETYELPLFPLNTVLFPGMYLPLHIFEDRYKELIALCVAEKRPFGVVFIAEGEAEDGPLPEPHRVGCTARITQMQPLEDGRMNIMAIGQDRFRILSLSHDRPYLVGQVEEAPLAAEAELMLDEAADQLFPTVLEYLEILARLGKVEFDTDQMPDSPLTLLYLAAALIQVPVEEKQAYLARDKATLLFADLQRVYLQEISLLRLLPDEAESPFSLN